MLSFPLLIADTFVQVYLSILYLRIPKTFKIILRGKVVEHHNIADDLMHPQYILYKPQAAGSEEVCKIFFFFENFLVVFLLYSDLNLGVQ